MKERFNNKNVFITGGIGYLGKELGVEFAQEGAQVFLIDTVDEKKAHSILKTYEDENYAIEYYRCDVTEEKQVQSLFEDILSKYGKLDILINCAAKAKLEPAEKMDFASWDETIKASLYGAFNCSQKAFEMLKRNKGNIVNVASIAALIGLPRGTTHHSAAKSALLGMTRSLAVEWAKYGIRVNAVAPGQFDTDSLQAVMKDKKNAENIIESIPLHRIGTVHEVAAGILFLASHDASFITGNTLVIDGGAIIS